jgi:hypothetical protein
MARLLRPVGIVILEILTYIPADTILRILDLEPFFNF